VLGVWIGRRETVFGAMPGLWLSGFILHFETDKSQPKGKSQPFDVKEEQNTHATFPASLRFAQGASLLGVAADSPAQSGISSTSKGIVE
jgi:hypothetical protein